MASAGTDPCVLGSLVPDTTATPQSPGTIMPGSLRLLKSTRTCILQQKKKAKVCQDATKLAASYHSYMEVGFIDVCVLLASSSDAVLLL